MSNALLVCIDFQNGYENQYTTLEWERFKSAVSGTIERFEQKGTPIIHVAMADQQFTHPSFQRRLPGILGCHSDVRQRMQTLGEYFEADFRRAPFNESLFAFALPVSDQALVAVKSTFSAASNQLLVDYIGDIGPRTIFLIGGREATKRDTMDKKCLTQTAKDFARRGNDVCIIEEVTDAFIENADKPPELLKMCRHHIHAPMGVRHASIDDIMVGIDSRAPVQATSASLLAAAL